METVQLTEEMQLLLDESLQILGLSVRTINGLENTEAYADRFGKVRQVTTIRQLLDMTEEELLARPGFGEKALQEVKDCLAKMGFHTRRKQIVVKPTEPQIEEFKTKISKRVTFEFGGRDTKKNVSAKPETRRNGKAVKPVRRASGHSTRGNNLHGRGD